MNQDNHPTQSNGLMYDALDGEAHEDSGSRRLQQILALLRGRWHWAILLALLLGGGLGVAAYNHVTPIYRSQGQISIDPAQQPDSLAEEDIRYYDRFLRLQADRIRSQEVVEAALRREEWRQLGLGEHITLDDVRRFRGRLRVDHPRDSQSLVVSFSHPSPEAARAGAISVMDAYRQIYSQRVSQVDTSRLARLQQRRDMLQRRIDRLEADQDELLEAAGAGNITERRQQKQQALWDTQEWIRDTRQMLELADAAEPGEMVDMASASIQQIARQDPQMRRLLDRQQAIQSEMQTLIGMGLADNHRQMRRAQAQLDTINRNIEDYAREYRDEGIAFQPGTAFAPDHVGPMGSPEELEVRLADLREREQQLVADLGRLSRLERELQRVQEQLQDRRQELRDRNRQVEELEMRPSDAERIVVAGVPDLPAEPDNSGRRLQLTLLGSVGGGATGVGLVMLLGLLDRRLRRLSDAELALPAVRILGILPSLPDKKTKPNQAAIAAHCIHHIRTMLQISEGNGAGNGADHHGRVLTVTSPAAGSGKTSLVTALGVSFAATGERTLLIDCDVVGGGLSRRLAVAARPSLETVLRRSGLIDEAVIAAAADDAERRGVSVDEALAAAGAVSAQELDRARRTQRDTSLGLFDVCQGESFDACVANTGVSNLFVLPIGGALPEQAGSLSPDAIQRLLAKARGRFDTVLIDTGPILGSLEASMTAAEADDVVLVVSRGDSRPAVVQAIENLHRIQANFAGIVFNHASDRDVHYSSYTSVMPEGSPLRSRPRHVDPETSARFGPVGSAVASFSSGQPARAAVNGHTVDVEGADTSDIFVIHDGPPNEGRHERRGRGRRADD